MTKLKEDPTTGAQKFKLVGIQSLRGIAAFIVVLCHLQIAQNFYFPNISHLPSWMIVGEFGVDLFFVISGFIITYVTERSLHTGRKQAAFLLRRFARIYPAYWAVVIPMVLVLIWYAAGVNNPEDFHPDILSSIFLLPQHEPSVLRVSWTLVYEIYFYLIASFVFRWQGRPRLYILAFWFVSIILVKLVHPSPFSNPYTDLCLSPLSLEFMAGAMLAYAFQNGSIYLSSPLAGSVTGMALIVAFLGGSSYGSFMSDPVRRLFFYGIPAFLVVWMVLQMERQGRWPWMKMIAPVGDRSYSLYLLHLPFFALTFKIASGFLHPSTPVELFAISLFILFAITIPVEFYYQLIEKPSHHAARRLAQRMESSSRPEELQMASGVNIRLVKKST